MDNGHYSRRLVLAGGLGLAAAGIARAAQGQAGGLAPTSEQALGPFFPLERVPDQDADLTRVEGTAGVARGQVINVVGRVVDATGRPLSGVRLDIWQANAAGRYFHPADQSDIPLDANFQGSTVIQTGAEGGFRFKTVKPGHYPIPGGRYRTAHIHFDIIGRRERLTTQMYFPGEALNETDILLPTAMPRESVMSRLVTLADDPGTPTYQWDVVLAVG